MSRSSMSRSSEWSSSSPTSPGMQSRRSSKSGRPHSARSVSSNLSSARSIGSSDAGYVPAQGRPDNFNMRRASSARSVSSSDPGSIWAEDRRKGSLGLAAQGRRGSIFTEFIHDSKLDTGSTGSGSSRGNSKRFSFTESNVQLFASSGQLQYESGFDPQSYRHQFFEDPAQRDEERMPLMPLHIAVEKVLEEEGLIMPPGPFSFVEANWFWMLSGCVILLNLIMMACELIGDPDLRQGFSNANQVCLGYFILELLARLLHFGRHFWWHPKDKTWNRFDFVIVVLGGIDQWLLPILKRMYKFDSTWLPLLRVLRVTRFLRIVRLVRVLVRGDFSWTEEPTFQTIVASVISFSAVVIGLETDYESDLWIWVENGMLLFFLFELVARLKKDGIWHYFTNHDDFLWNWLDFGIVLASTIDLWVMRILAFVLQLQEGSELGRLTMLMRMLRLVRILRLLRLVKAVKPLYILAVGLLETMQSIFWVLVLTLVALYAIAIFTTRMIGHGADPQRIPERTRVLFNTLADSMFTLFSIMNGHAWSEVEPLMSNMPWTKPIFVVFTIYASWALLSVMTGVVSDNMLNVRETQGAKDEEQLNARRELIDNTLQEVFASADVLGNGIFDREQLLNVLQMDYHVKKLQKAINVPLMDLRVMFEWLDYEGKGKIKSEDLMYGFHALTEPITGKSLLQLDFDLKHRFTELELKLSDIDAHVERVRQRNESICDELMEVADSFRLSRPSF